MKQIAISASLRHKDLIKQVISDLEKVNIVGLFPNLDSEIAKDDVSLKLMKKLETEHFNAIDISEGLYVICPEGHVGTLVSVEIGYAFAKGKPIIFSQEPEDLGLQAVATNYVSIEKIKEIKGL
ncbi:MAG: hypothetical protein PHQ59_04060 [Candidatus Daviesbacteria bacterium]|nr:hypothetical protein [Candidatus Daviesbacteria bacterium]